MSLCKRSKKNEKRCTKNVRKQRSVVMSLPMFIPMWIDAIFQELLKEKYVFSAFPNEKSTAFRARSSVSLKKHIEQQLALPAIFHFFCCPDLLGLYQCLQFFLTLCLFMFTYVYWCLLAYFCRCLVMSINVVLLLSVMITLVRYTAVVTPRS